MRINKLIPVYGASLTLAVIFSPVLFQHNAYALEKEAVTKISILRESEETLKQQSEIVDKKSDVLQKTDEQVKTIEKKKESLSSEVDKLKEELEKMKAEVAAKKAAQAEAERIAALPVAQPLAVQSAVAPTLTRGYSGSSAGNSYAWGQCTWYVKNRRPDIGNFWGNADMWVYSARSSGYSTGSVPVAGAIGQENGIMHVVYVESVSGNMVNISEMNYAGGVGQIHYRTAPASNFTYIY